jgi:PAS domain S-box-containing protein
MGTGLELLGRRQDGSEFSVEISLSSFETHTGRHFISTIRDITARAKAHKKLEALLDSAPDAMVVVDLERRIQLVNSQTERMFGFNRAELVGSEIEVLIPERFRVDHPEKFSSYAKDARARPMASNLQLFGRRQDGTEFPVEVSLSPVETEDGLLISSAIRDVSERIAR